MGLQEHAVRCSRHIPVTILHIHREALQPGWMTGGLRLLNHSDEDTKTFLWCNQSSAHIITVPFFTLDILMKTKTLSQNASKASKLVNTT